MQADSRKTLVVAPEMSFGDIAATLAALGWESVSNPMVEPPLLTGEPELASWLLKAEGLRASYSFNPVVLLRVLELEGRNAAQAASRLGARLPCVDENRVGSLLESHNPRDVLLGLYAAAELKAIDLLPDVESLRVHTDRRVSMTAAQTSEKLAMALLELGADRLAQEQRRRPGYSVLFSRVGDVVARRETLLWLLHDKGRGNVEVAKVLRTALADADWRVRVTAMLVAARMKVSAVWQEIRHMEIPGTGPKGLDRRHHSLLVALRKAVLAELAGEPRQAPNDERSRLMLHLRAVVSGEEDGIRDEAREWIEAWLDAPAPDPA